LVEAFPVTTRVAMSWDWAANGSGIGERNETAFLALVVVNRIYIWCH